MREIKFRAWDKRANKFIPPYNYVSAVTGDLVLELKNSDFVEFSQYTGLKDKNGVEIYEGDIVDFASRFDNSKRIGKVVYYAGDAAFLIEDGKEIFFLFYDALEREVIGNIYKNPELLNKR